MESVQVTSDLTTPGHGHARRQRPFREPNGEQTGKTDQILRPRADGAQDHKRSAQRPFPTLEKDPDPAADNGPVQLYAVGGRADQFVSYRELSRLVGAIQQLAHVEAPARSSSPAPRYPPTGRAMPWPS